MLEREIRKMRRYIPQNNINTSFCNPFAEGVFKYNGTIYNIDQDTAILLYLYLYGLTSKSLWKLFYIKKYGDEAFYELPKIHLFKVLSRLDRTGGCKRNHKFATMIDKMYRAAKRKDIIVDRRDFTPKEFNNRGREVFIPWVQIYILDKYPNIINDLKKSFPNIKIFL
jgi:hypothetical protein